MIRQAVPVRGGRPDWVRIEEIVAGYANVDVPCLIVWGERDELFPASMGYKLAAQCPDGRLQIVGKGTHCLPVEQPALCTRVIREFIDCGLANAPEVRWTDGLTDAASTPVPVQSKVLSTGSGRGDR